MFIGKIIKSIKIRSFETHLILIWFTIVISADLYNKLEKTKVTGLKSGLTIQKNNIPIGCLLECNQRVECNLVTITDPNICNLYFVLQENNCITNYTKQTGVAGTSLFIKSKNTINETCRTSKQCMYEFGLSCVNGKCSCSSTS